MRGAARHIERSLHRYRAELLSCGVAPARQNLVLASSETMVSSALDNKRAAAPDAQPSTVLFLAANPVQIPLLQLGEECRAIEDKIRTARFRDQLQFRSRWAARPDDLLQALHEHDPAVLHFSGHGAGAQGLCFLAEDGGIFCVSSEGLGQVIRAAGDGIQLVVLNACYTKLQAEALAAHVPCVIGMPDVIGDKAAILYAAELYRALAFGKSVAIAHQCGLASLTMHSTSGQARDVEAAKVALRTPPPELLTREGIDAARIHIVGNAQTASTAAAGSGESRIHLEIDIDLDFEALDPLTLGKLVSEIRRLSGGRPVRILCVTKGSVKLSLSFEPEAAQALLELRSSGQLTEILGSAVSRIVEMGPIEISPQWAERELRLIDAGEPYPTLAEARKAVEHHRVLAARNPDDFQLALATSLHRLAVLSREAGQPGPALAAAREAVDLHRALVKRSPDEILATGLHDLGLILWDTGQREPALATTREAVEDYRALAARDPDRFEHDLARSMHDLGRMLWELGHHTQALDATREAVDRLRVLATSDPAKLRQLATGLHCLGLILRELGQHEPALVAMREATELRRTLASRDPDEGQLDLARSLHDLGLMLRELGDAESAVAATREAVDLHRAVVARDPTALPGLAGSLTNLGNRLRELGHHTLAVEASREAVDLHRTLCERDPDKFQPALASNLHNLSILSHQLPAQGPPLSAAREAVDVHRALAASNPERFEPELVEALTNLGNLYQELAEIESALVVTREVVELCRSVAGRSTDEYEPLARSLNDLNDRYRALGERPSALAAAREAVTLYRALAQRDPIKFEPCLADSLNNLGVDLAELRQRDSAFTAMCEAVALYRVLASRDPEKFQPDLARSARNLDVIQPARPVTSLRARGPRQPGSPPLPGPTLTRTGVERNKLN